MLFPCSCASGSVGAQRGWRWWQDGRHRGRFGGIILRSTLLKGKFCGVSLASCPLALLTGPKEEIFKERLSVFKSTRLERGPPHPLEAARTFWSQQGAARRPHRAPLPAAPLKYPRRGVHVVSPASFAVEDVGKTLVLNKRARGRANVCKLFVQRALREVCRSEMAPRRLGWLRQGNKGQREP